MVLAPGARLGPYEILAPLGAGAMGEVYRARDPRLGRDVAIKVLPPAFAADPDRLRRFEQEARAVAALPAPGRRSLELSKIDLRTGKRVPWRTLVPADAVGATRIGSPLVAADGSTYAYTYGSHSSNLYLVKGLR